MFRSCRHCKRNPLPRTINKSALSTPSNVRNENGWTPGTMQPPGKRPGTGELTRSRNTLSIVTGTGINMLWTLLFRMWPLASCAAGSDFWSEDRSVHLSGAPFAVQLWLSLPMSGGRATNATAQGFHHLRATAGRRLPKCSRSCHHLGRILRRFFDIPTLGRLRQLRSISRDRVDHHFGVGMGAMQFFVGPLRAAAFPST